jgi:hypothetical protein
MLVMPEPCIAMPMPTARTLPLPMSRQGYLLSQSIISRTRARHLSSVQLVLTWP